MSPGRKRKMPPRLGSARPGGRRSSCWRRSAPRRPARGGAASGGEGGVEELALDAENVVLPRSEFRE
eukprot:15052224-Alexandrium_andersonii.AAC.1